MEVTRLRCSDCGREYAPEARYYCERCNFPLAVDYAPATVPVIEDTTADGIWGYHESLPRVSRANRVTLGEGRTPLLAGPRIAGRIGVSRLYFKLEGSNPTGSFKDRPMALGTGLALDLGTGTVTTSSTGNAGASLAAYAARSGLHAVVFASDTIPPSKLAPIALHGAKIIRVMGSVSDAFSLVCEATGTWGWFNLTSTFVNPYIVEADKTVAYELLDDLGTVPDVVVIPVGAGPLLVGVHRGFIELQNEGLADRIPRLIAVQSEGCAPIVRAFERENPSVEPWDDPRATVAGGIADPLNGYSDDGTYTLRAVRASGGFAIACSDNEILDAVTTLMTAEGVAAEPTAATSLAGTRKALERGLLSQTDTVVCLITARGAKRMDQSVPPPDSPRAIRASLEAVETELARGEMVTG